MPITLNRNSKIDPIKIAFLSHWNFCHGSDHQIQSAQLRETVSHTDQHKEKNAMKDRRSFLKAAGAGVLSATAYQNVLGANERVRVGFIGIGLIGKRHLLDFLAQTDVEVAAICEVYEPRLREG